MHNYCGQETAYPVLPDKKDCPIPEPYAPSPSLVGPGDRASPPYPQQMPQPHVMYPPRNEEATLPPPAPAPPSYYSQQPSPYPLFQGIYTHAELQSITGVIYILGQRSVSNPQVSLVNTGVASLCVHVHVDSNALY